MRTVGNALAILWLTLVVFGLLRPRGGRRQAPHDGTGLVMWGSYLVGVLALNVHASPFGTAHPLIQSAGIAVAATAVFARGVTRAWAAPHDHARRCHLMPACMAAFCIGITAASGNLIALATVVVATAAATVVALSGAPRRDWDAGSR